jgi:hypothetical protein
MYQPTSLCGDKRDSGGQQQQQQRNSDSNSA